MTSIYILNQELNIVGVLDEYVSLIWRPAYYGIGDFELYLSASRKNLELLQADRYIVRSSDISIDSDGKATYSKVMIIKNLQITTDIENGNYLTVTGRELKYLLNKRIIWNQTNLKGTVEDSIRRLVDENAINPTDTKRIIPNLVLGAKSGLEKTLSKQVRGDYLDEAIINICTAYNYGWDVFIYDGSLVFIIYEGLDRSYNQNVRPYVVFSPEFDNLYTTDYQLMTEGYANTALIAGEGEGTARKTTTINDSYTGLARSEIFVDARDLSQNADSSEASEIISDSDYIDLLKERGAEKIAELATTEGFSGEILSNITFRYGTDFDLGDIVTVINEYGISREVRVLSAIESEDEEGIKLIPEFNI